MNHHKAVFSTARAHRKNSDDDDDDNSNNNLASPWIISIEFPVRADYVVSLFLTEEKQKTNTVRIQMIPQPSNDTTAIKRYYSHHTILQPSNDTTAITRYYSHQMIPQPSNDTTAITRYYSHQMILQPSNDTTAIK
jgi:hypothetical protein